jgi:hypothetical protein
MSQTVTIGVTGADLDAVLHILRHFDDGCPIFPNDLRLAVNLLRRIKLRALKHRTHVRKGDARFKRLAGALRARRS